MPISEGSFTLSTQLFLTDVLGDDSDLSTEFTNLNDPLLLEGSIPDSLVDVFDNLGSVDGRWDFWERLYHSENAAPFEFSPLFLRPDFDLELGGRHFTTRFDLERYDVTPRFLYYPFGLVVVRVRCYFKFADPVSAGRLVEFAEAFPHRLTVNWNGAERDATWRDSSDEILKSLVEAVLVRAFGGEIPQRYSGRLGELKTYPTHYLYDADDFGPEDIATLVKMERRSLNDENVERFSNPQFGYFEGDRLVAKSQGAVIYTPLFNERSPASRRWKRVQVRNNFYLASDFALFVDHYGDEVCTILDRTLDQLTDGTVTGVPLRPKYLLTMKRAVSFGGKLRGLRSRVYEEMSPSDEDQYLADIERYIDRIADHDSELRKLLERLSRPWVL